MAKKSNDLTEENEQTEAWETCKEESTTDIKTEKDPSKKEYDELHNQYLRLAADFENFRKRQAQEREHMFKFASQSTIEALLPVIDNLERAKQSLTESSDPKMLYKSFEMLSNQMLDELKNLGLNRIHPKGETFNPEQHEAISQVEDQSVSDCTIVDVYKDGYMLFDKVIRPAQVIVSVQPAKLEPLHEEQPLPENNFKPIKPDKNGNPFQQQTTSSS